MKRSLDFAKKRKVCIWLETNFEKLKGLKSETVADMCFKETGIIVTAQMLLTISRAADLKLFDRSVIAIRTVAGWHNVAACFARAINDLHQQMGTTSSEKDNLALIIQRYHGKVTEAN